jgi:hypothetical protein
VSEVNRHYLDHVVKLSETSDIEASEDIVNGNGVKLLAKGTKIDARARERLLEFRLAKPLENMMRVVGGTDPASFHPIAEQLMERHSLLRGICETSQSFSPLEAIGTVELSSNVLSLLSVYAAQSGEKLEHAVGVALLCAAFGDGLSRSPADIGALVTSGLVHDVGELYIDPAFLSRKVRLTPQQWKHVATHPIVGSHVLGAMPGAGPRVANVVMTHHERLDGFGYPQGLLGAGLPMAGQILAVAEMLMGVLESGTHHAARVTVALKLVPGEFHRRFVDRVARWAGSVGMQPDNDEPADLAGLQDRIAQLAGIIVNVRRLREGMRAEIEAGRFGPALRTLAEHAFARWERIMIAFSSTGLDLVADGDLAAVLAGMTPADRMEVGIVLRELQWRIGELDRQLMIRGELFGPADAQYVQMLIERAPQPAPALA